jgi:exonuclease V gamma subunit
MLPPHRAGQAVCWTAGALNGKRLVQGWLDYLALAATRADTTLSLLGVDDSEVQQLRFAGLPQPVAHAAIAHLLRCRREGLRSPLLFFPKTSAAYARHWRANATAHDGDRHAEALSAGRMVFESGDRSIGEGERVPAFALIARDRDLFDAGSAASRDFGVLARSIFEPLFAALDGVSP